MLSATGLLRKASYLAAGCHSLVGDQGATVGWVWTCLLTLSHQYHWQLELLTMLASSSPSGSHCNNKPFLCNHIFYFNTFLTQLFYSQVYSEYLRVLEFWPSRAGVAGAWLDGVERVHSTADSINGLQGGAKGTTAGGGVPRGSSCGQWDRLCEETAIVDCKLTISGTIYPISSPSN